MSTISRARFITFEGPDGSGKSTQARMLAERLRGAGRTVLETVEPGGTPIGQQIRRILLDPTNKELTPVAELLLMFAARAQNVEQWILPALEQAGDGRAVKIRTRGAGGGNGDVRASEREVRIGAQPRLDLLSFHGKQVLLR